MSRVREACLLFQHNIAEKNTLLSIHLILPFQGGKKIQGREWGPQYNNHVTFCVHGHSHRLAEINVGCNPVWGLLRTCSSPEHLQPEVNSKWCPASHLCPFRACTLTAGPSYLQLVSFRALQTSKQPLKMQAEITKLAQASMSNLQLPELPKCQNGSCIEQLLHASDWKLCRHPVRMWESAAEDYTMGILYRQAMSLHSRVLKEHCSYICRNWGLLTNWSIRDRVLDQGCQINSHTSFWLLYT